LHERDPHPKRDRSMRVERLFGNLVLSPHPDDDVIGCGGALLRHREGGDHVVLIEVSDGSASRSGGLLPDAMARQRAREATEAAHELGAELVWLGLREGQWEHGALTRILGELLREHSPDVIYAPSPVDFHPEHVRVALALAEALRAHDDTFARIYEIQVPLGPQLVNLIVETEAVDERRKVAASRHASQNDTLRTVDRLRRYNRAFWGENVQCFWQLTPSQYRSVVAAGDWTCEITRFRGIRPRPIIDPLSYIAGWGQRQRLSRVASACLELRDDAPR
jgi:LmbE family N-acetylglucosaminyl deacetylase